MAVKDSVADEHCLLCKKAKKDTKVCVSFTL